MTELLRGDKTVVRFPSEKRIRTSAKAGIRNDSEAIDQQLRSMDLALVALRKRRRAILTIYGQILKAGVSLDGWER
jgi:hypothetical protein